MSKDTTTQAPIPEDGRRDDLTDLLREGAKRLIAEAVEAEVSATLSEFADYTDDAGLSRASEKRPVVDGLKAAT